MNHKITEKIDRLDNLSTALNDPLLRESFISFLNQYDTEISGILSSSERNCCQVGRHCSLLFTPELKNLLRRRRQLQQQLNKNKKSRFSDPIPGIFDTIKKQQKQLQSTTVELREYSKTQREKRDAYLEERAIELTKKRAC